MWLGSDIAVAVVQASGYSPNWTPSLGPTICHECGPKKKTPPPKKYWVATEKLLELISKFSKVTGDKSIFKNQLYFYTLTMNNCKSKILKPYFLQ